MNTETPKTIEDLDKLLEEQKQKRNVEYQKRKRLFAFSAFFGPRLSYGITTFPDLIGKDKTFWKLLPLSLLLYASLGIGLHFIFVSGISPPYLSFYPAITVISVFLVFRLILGFVIYKKMKNAFPNGKGLLMQSVFFPFSFRLIAILTVILGLYFFYFLSRY